MTTDLSSTLSGIRERGYRNGATGALCARLSDSAAIDVPRLLAALDAVLKLADDWRAIGCEESAEEEALMWQRIECGETLRGTITSSLASPPGGEDTKG